MARDYLCIPGEFQDFVCISHFKHSLATSVDVERTFSRGWLLLSHIRKRMSAESTRALLCLNNRSKQGLVKHGDLQEVATLPEVDGEEGEQEGDAFGSVL
jgi:hypothetical protein